MLATLERPSSRSAMSDQAPRFARLAPSTIQPTRLTLLLPPADPLPALAPGLPSVSDDRARPLRVDAATKLRLTLRARRLLAGLAFLCAMAVGVVAVDVLSAAIPFTPATYPAQAAPYDGSSVGQGASDGMVPASGSSIVVAVGDTLWGVAQRVDPDADPRRVIAAIMSLNGLDSPNIQAGQVLRLP